MVMNLSPKNNTHLSKDEIILGLIYWGGRVVVQVGMLLLLLLLLLLLMVLLLLSALVRRTVAVQVARFAVLITPQS